MQTIQVQNASAVAVILMNANSPKDGKNDETCDTSRSSARGLKLGTTCAIFWVWRHLEQYFRPMVTACEGALDHGWPAEHVTNMDDASSARKNAHCRQRLFHKRLQGIIVYPLDRSVGFSFSPKLVSTPLLHQFVFLTLAVANASLAHIIVNI